MLKFEYEIKLNDDGRPYIHIPEDYDDIPEDKFMALEITRYIMYQVLEKRRNSEINETELMALETTFDTLEKVSDEVAILIKEQMEMMGQTTLAMKRNYHIQVDNVKKRDELNYEGIIYNNKIFKRDPGLKVLVLNSMKVYELQGGRDNEHWVEIKE